MTDIEFRLDGPIVRFVPWPDAIVDRHGLDPRGDYAERFWLPVIGPTTLWLLRRLAVDLEQCPDGLSAELHDLSLQLGLGPSTARHSVVVRTVERLCMFRLGFQVDRDEIAVRRKVPPLTQGQVARLPMALQREHQTWRRQERERLSAQTSEPARSAS